MAANAWNMAGHARPLLLLRWCWLLDLFRPDNPRLGLELLVILIPHGKFHGGTGLGEVERAVRSREGREPVTSVDLFAVGFELRELLIRALLQDAGGTAVALYD